jgi:hypothetical protein
MSKFFQKVLMESESIASQNRSARFQAQRTDAEVYGGAFVVVTGMALNAVYSAYTPGIKDFNVLTVEAPANVDDKNIYVIDLVAIADATGMGNTYRIGAKTIGLKAAAGVPVRMRKLAVEDEFLLSVDNFVAPPVVGQYAVLTAGSVDLTAAVGIPVAGLCVQIEQRETISQGTDGNVDAYLCRVVQL